MSKFQSTSKRSQGKRPTPAEKAQAKQTFLDAYKLNGNIMLSCKRAGIDRVTFYQWCEHDVEFGLRYKQAEGDFAELVLAEFVKRATTGYEKPVVSMGKIVYQDGKPLMERVVSDNLLAMLVKRHFPEFREKQQLDVNTTVMHRDPLFQQLTDEQLADIEHILSQTTTS